MKKNDTSKVKKSTSFDETTTKTSLRQELAITSPDTLRRATRTESAPSNILSNSFAQSYPFKTIHEADEEGPSTASTPTQPKTPSTGNRSRKGASRLGASSTLASNSASDSEADIVSDNDESLKRPPTPYTPGRVRIESQEEETEIQASVIEPPKFK